MDRGGNPVEFKEELQRFLKERGVALEQK